MAAGLALFFAGARPALRPAQNQPKPAGEFTQFSAYYQKGTLY